MTTPDEDRRWDRRWEQLRREARAMSYLVAAHLIGDHASGETCTLTAEEILALRALERDLEA